MNNRLAQGITTTFSLGNFLNTLNPLSRLAGRSHLQYVPKWLADATTVTNPTGQQIIQGAQTAHLIAKIVGGSAIAGLATWLLRKASDTASTKFSKANKASRTPGDKLQSQFKKPTKALIQPKRKKKKEQPKEPQEQQPKEEIQKSANYDMASVALPTSAALLTALAMLSITDKHMDQKHGRRLQRQQARLKKELDSIMLQRAYRNRGVTPEVPQQIKTASMEKVAKDPNRNRSVTGFSAIDSVAGVALLAIAAIAAKAGYQYDRDNNKAVKQFQARQKGLKAYIKARESQQNIYNNALDPELVKKLDSGMSGKAPVVDTTKTYKELDI